MQIGPPVICTSFGISRAGSATIPIPIPHGLDLAVLFFQGALHLEVGQVLVLLSLALHVPDDTGVHLLWVC